MFRRQFVRVVREPRSSRHLLLRDISGNLWRFFLSKARRPVGAAAQLR